MSIFIIAEIGINHNGDIELAKKLIDGAADAGADAVKFQKRTLDRVYSQEELDKYRESPWGTTNRAQKKGLEFEKREFDIIDQYCKTHGISWFASAWDLESQDFLAQYPCHYNKVASAMITHTELLVKIAKQQRYTFISTGMSSIAEIQSAVNIFKEHQCPFEIMHCTSTYPSKPEELNLSCIASLRDAFKCKVGYSGHEVGLSTSVAAAALGATSIERHITLDRSMYGSDQAASIEIAGFKRLVRDIRTVEAAIGDGKKVVYESELPIRQKLRRNSDMSAML